MSKFNDNHSKHTFLIYKSIEIKEQIVLNYESYLLKSNKGEYSLFNLLGKHIASGLPLSFYFLLQGTIPPSYNIK
jgi:hypothetical protein